MKTKTSQINPSASYAVFSLLAVFALLLQPFSITTQQHAVKADSVERVAVYQQNFDEFNPKDPSTIPSHWKIDGLEAYQSKSVGYYGQSANSLKFTGDGLALLALPVDGLVSSEISFWLRGATVSGNSTFVVEQLAENTNIVQQDLFLWSDGTLDNSLKNVNQRLKLDESARYVQFYYKKDKGNVALDDVTVWGRKKLDPVKPERPAPPTNLRRVAKDGSAITCDATARNQAVTPTWERSASADVTHYEYSSFNADGKPGIVERNLGNVTSFNTNGWVSPNEGGAVFALRAVGRGGKKSDWAYCAVNWQKKFVPAPTDLQWNDGAATVDQSEGILTWRAAANTFPKVAAYEYEYKAPSSEIWQQPDEFAKLTPEMIEKADFPTRILLEYGEWDMRVRAVASDGAVSDWAKTSVAYAPAVTEPVEPAPETPDPEETPGATPDEPKDEVETPQTPGEVAPDKPVKQPVVNRNQVTVQSAQTDDNRAEILPNRADSNRDKQGKINEGVESLEVEPGRALAVKLDGDVLADTSQATWGQAVTESWLPLSVVTVVGGVVLLLVRRRRRQAEN